MTARPHRAGGRLTGPAPAPPPLPTDTDELAVAVDDALAAAHRVEREMRRSMAAAGVAATARRLGISRATAQRLKAGRWPVTTALRRLQCSLRR